VWRFVPAEYVFPDPTVPWNAPVSEGQTNLTTDVESDFLAIKLGDVNDSWTMPVEQGSAVAASEGVEAASSGDEVRFRAGNHIAQLGETVKVPITVSEFREVTSAQFTLAWNPEVLRFLGVEDYGLSGLSAGNFGMAKSAEGMLAFSWYEPEAAGLTLADGATIFTVSFEVTGLAGSLTSVALTDFPTLREASVNLAVALIAADDGGIISVIEGGGLRVSEPVHQEGVFQLTVPSEIGRRYVLEFTDRLPAMNWTALPAVVGDGKALLLVDLAATNHQRFYRVRID